MLCAANLPVFESRAAAHTLSRLLQANCMWCYPCCCALQTLGRICSLETPRLLQLTCAAAHSSMASKLHIAALLLHLADHCVVAILTAPLAAAYTVAPRRIMGWGSTQHHPFWRPCCCPLQAVGHIRLAKRTSQRATVAPAHTPAPDVDLRVLPPRCAAVCRLLAPLVPHRPGTAQAHTLDCCKWLLVGNLSCAVMVMVVIQHCPWQGPS